MFHAVLERPIYRDNQRSQVDRRSRARGPLNRRSGISIFDILVSAMMLGVVMSTTTSLCFRIHQVWKNIAQQRVATHELANQLELLTRCQPEQLQRALEKLQASELCQRSLFEAQLSGQQSVDPLGIRVTIQLKWSGHPGPMSAQMSAWLIDPRASLEAQPGLDLEPALEPKPASNDSIRPADDSKNEPGRATAEFRAAGSKHKFRIRNQTRRCPAAERIPHETIA